ncbi:hypothetical protein ACGFIY_25710 [Micromonospora chersina]
MIWQVAGAAVTDGRGVGEFQAVRLDGPHRRDWDPVVFKHSRSPG